MKLQRDDSICTSLFDIFISDINGCDAIDFVNEVIAARDNVVLVPVFFFDLFLNLIRIADGTNDLGFMIFTDDGFLATQSQNATKAFAVENAGIFITGFKVSLVATHAPFVGTGNREATVLYS